MPRSEADVVACRGAISNLKDALEHFPFSDEEKAELWSLISARTVADKLIREALAGKVVYPVSTDAAGVCCR